MKDKATSPEHQEKPTYKIQVEAEKFADSQFTIPYEEMDEFNHAKYTGIMIGYNCAASKANARIASLESENSYLQTQLDMQKRINDRLESELKALREERDELQNRLENTKKDSQFLF